MPTLSFFYGIVISMYFDDHNPPHFHARYQDYEVELTFDGEVMEGEFPKKQLRFVRVWAEIHKEDLMTNWEMLKKEGKVERIDPLR